MLIVYDYSLIRQYFKYNNLLLVIDINKIIKIESKLYKFIKKRDAKFLTCMEEIRNF